MSISCIIIEDQPPAQRILQHYIGDMAVLNLKGTFGDSLSALEFLKTESVDLIFLDIHLPKISGIDFLSFLHPKPKIIFTTAFSDYALKGYELDITDYLLKPFSFERFVKAVAKVMFTNNNGRQKATFDLPLIQEKFIFVKAGYDYIKMAIADIRYVKAEGDYTCVYTRQAKHLISHPLKYWTQHLPTSRFCQIHKSYLVNIHFIEKVSGNQVIMADAELPIGRIFKEFFKENYLDFFSDEV